MTEMSEHDFKRLNQEKLKDAPRPLSLWRHYKGGWYEVVCSACLEAEPEQVIVVYRSQTYGYLLARTLENWLEPVRWPDGQLGPRFRPAGDFGLPQ
jgi:hypothetical protein